jgi:hypothetical protein
MAVTLTSILISIAVSMALSVTMRVLSSLLAPHQSSSFGGSLQQTKDSGTQVTVRNPDQPHQIVFGRRRVQGNIVFAHVTENNSLLHLVVEWAGHQVDGYEDLYFFDELVPLNPDGSPVGKYHGWSTVSDHLGTPDQLADASLMGQAPGKWTADHRGRGIAYSYINLRWNRDLFPQGLPNIWRVVRGMPLYDPRTETTAWSANAALAVAAWMNSDRYGRSVPYGGRNGIDTDALSAAANICDEDILLASGGSEKRYTANGVLQSDQPFVDNIERLLSACHGTATPIGGQWVIDAAAWEEPTLVLEEKHFRAPFTITNGTGNDEAFNAIKGTFVNPDKLWNKDDFPAIVVPQYEIEDGGDGNGLGREFKDVALEFTDSAPMAQRIVRIDLRQARQPISFTGPVKLIGLRLRAGNTVGINNAYLGWVAKPFKVNRVRMVLGFAPGSGGSQGGGQLGIVGVDLDLRETAPEIYDWNPAIDELPFDPAPNTNLPDAFNVGAASNVRTSERNYSARDGGGVKTQFTIAWDASPDGFVISGGKYRVQYRATGSTSWQTVAETTDLFAVVPDIAPGRYDARVIALNYTGATSAPVELDGIIVVGLNDTPSAPANFQVTAAGMGTLAMLRWDKSPDLDVLQGGSFVVRFSSKTDGATWADAVTISAPMDGGQTTAVLPLKTGTYLAKFVDSTGHWSDAASVVSTQGSSLDFSVVGSVTESPTFGGACTGCFVSGGVLQIAPAGDFDAAPDVDALAAWDWFGGVRTSNRLAYGDPFAVPTVPPDPVYLGGAPSPGYALGDPVAGFAFGSPGGPAASYAFASVLDLGTVQSVRLTSALSSLVLNVTDDFDSRSGVVDEWAAWDGLVTGQEADAILMVQATSDNPASPGAVWSAWNRMDSAEYTARAFRARLDLYSYDSAFNIDVSALALVAETP